MVVVIGILAVLTTNSYRSSVPDKKTTDDSLVNVTLQSELTNITNQLRIDQASSADGSYPATLAGAKGGLGVTLRQDITYEYAVDNDANPKTFCVSATQKDVSYMSTNNSSPAEGVCPE
ncbi:MAG TPA: hypothetical protein VFD55_02080 [Candidatus Angelobacter sp.]|nr:hypothetical protein [Candidatus Angelobacter sp.]